MRHGPEGRDPGLSRDVEHWSVRVETDWPLGGMMVLPPRPPWTVEVKVKFATRESADAFERAVMEMLRS